MFKVLRFEDNKEYAMKQVKVFGMTDKEKANAANEVRIMASVRSPFIMAYREAFWDEPTSTLNIVMEFADEGDCYKAITESHAAKVYLKEKMVWKIII